MADKPILYDMLTRHQIFLEGVKVYGAQKFNERLKELQGKLQVVILSVPHDNVGDMSRKEITGLVARVQRAAQSVMTKSEKEVTDFLLALMLADLGLSREIFAIDAPKEPPNDPAQLASEKVADDPKAMWAYIEDQPMPSDGSLLPALIAGFGANVILQLAKQTRMAYANNDTPKDLLSAIVGTVSNNYKDGAFAKMFRDNSAIVATGVQHVSSILQGTLASFSYDKYQWVSVLDANTTDICIERDGNVYKYGEGPLPPAHFNCRSKTVPFVVSQPIPDQTYFGWLKTQPDEVLSEIMSAADAAKFKAGNLKKDDLPKFRDAKPLSIAEFSGKLKTITA